MNKTEEFIRQNELKKAQIREESSQGNKKKKKGGFKRFVCFLLVIALILGIYRLGFVDPGWFIKKGNGEEGTLISGVEFFEEAFDSSEAEPKGFSKISVSKEDMDAEPVSAIVNADNTRAELENGVCVDFGDFNLGTDDAVLEVLSIGVRSDEDYEAMIYDFSLENTKQFASNVEITVPYDASWGEDVFVQYYNENTGNWQLMWSDINNEGKVTFSTNHFSTYAVFRSRVDALLKSESGIFSVCPDPAGNPYNEYVIINHKLLRQEVDKGSEKTIEDIAKRSQNDFLTTALEDIGFSSDFAEETDMLVSLGGSTPFVEAASKSLGTFGNVMGVAKVMVVLYQTQDIMRTFEKCKSELSSLALGVIGSSMGGPIAGVCSVIATGLFFYEKFDDFNYKGTDKAAEYAYREFSNNYLTYKMNTDILKGVCGYNYADNKKYEDVANSTIQDNEMRLRSNAVCDYADWYTPLEYISKHYSFEAVPTALESLIRQYSSVFFDKVVKDKKVFDRFLEETGYGLLGLDTLKSSYEKPSGADKKDYIEKYRKDLYKWITPYTEKLIKDSKTDLLDGVVQACAELEKQLGSRMTFELKGVSQYEDCEFILANSKTGRESAIRLVKENNYSAECTFYYFIKEEWPSSVVVKDKDGNVLLTKDFSVDSQSIVINLDSLVSEDVPTDKQVISGGVTYNFSYCDSDTISDPKNYVAFYLREAFMNAVATVSEDGSCLVKGSASGSDSGKKWSVTAEITSNVAGGESRTEGSAVLTAAINYSYYNSWNNDVYGSWSFDGKEYTSYTSGSTSTNSTVTVTATGATETYHDDAWGEDVLKFSFDELKGIGQYDSSHKETVTYPYDPTHPDDVTDENDSSKIDTTYPSFSIEFSK